jgi:phage repressor protein C with HTH and peptisase S24 domain
MKLHELLAQRLSATGITKAELTKRLGVSWSAVHQWVTGDTIPKGERLLLLFDALGLRNVRLAEDRDVISFETNETTLKRAPIRQKRDVENGTVPPNNSEVRTVRLPRLSAEDMPRDVPVLGVVLGGTNGDFALNGQTIDYVRRPPSLSAAAGLFALYVSSDSMSPRFEDGDLIYVSEARTPAPGDDVVIELQPAAEGEPSPAFIKRLMARKGGFWVCHQFNPPAEVRFAAERVKRVFRVIPLAELLGV